MSCWVGCGRGGQNERRSGRPARRDSVQERDKLCTLLHGESVAYTKNVGRKDRSEDGG
jgi:hypothetical protein